MLGSPHRRTRSGLWFAGFTVASLLMLLASRTDPALALQDAAARALDPVRSTLSGFGAGVADLFAAVGEIDRLRSENDELRRQLAAAEQRLAELREAAAENEELRGLLGLTTSLDMELLPVRITTRDPGNFTWEVGIDAGTDDGLRVGMPVVGAADGHGALAGRVVAVTGDRATVRLVVDTRSRVVALDQQTRALGLVEGQLGGQLVMVQVRVTDEVAVGDTIVTAGLALTDDAASAARSPFPRGLLIGSVAALQRDANALTVTAFLRPAIDFDRIDRLLVVLDFSQD